jgi:hypothetical protein
MITFRAVSPQRPYDKTNGFASGEMFRDGSFKKTQGEISFCGKTIDKSIQATRCCLYPFL